MRIQYDTTLLCDSASLTRTGPVETSLNGERLVDEVQFFRAATRTFYARGGHATTLQFTVVRDFSSARAAQLFYLQHAGSLPDSGLLAITCGEGSDLAVVYLEDAVLRAVAQPPFLGRTVRVQYTLVGGRFTGEEPPEVPTEETVVLKKGSTPIADGADDVDVVFDTPFAGAPLVVPSVAIPDDTGDAIWAMLDESSVTATGFTAKLSGATPSTGYKLNWVAVL